MVPASRPPCADAVPPHIGSQCRRGPATARPGWRGLRLAAGVALGRVGSCLARLARLARTRPEHPDHVPRPGQEVDLPEDRHDKAEGLQGHRRRPVLQGGRHGAQQGVVGKDEKHPGPVDPAGTEVRPHRPERRRACRPAAGPAGHPSRAMTEEQASKVLQAASGQPAGFVKVVKASKGRYGATHAASEAGELACGNKPGQGAPTTEIGTDLSATTCRSCRAHLGLDGDADASRRLEALFVLSITLGLRPGELRRRLRRLRPQSRQRKRTRRKRRDRVVTRLVT